MDAWGIDVVITASQKGLGTPPGLSILAASQKAIKVFEKRSTPVTSYYASWKKYIYLLCILYARLIVFPKMAAYHESI